MHLVNALLVDEATLDGAVEWIRQDMELDDGASPSNDAVIDPSQLRSKRRQVFGSAWNERKH